VGLVTTWYLGDLSSLAAAIPAALLDARYSREMEAEADAYYASRARTSRLGAWASKQSRPLESRFALEKAVAEYGLKYAVGEIPRPPFWSGFRVLPARIEFWRDMPFRLHERRVFHRDGAAWRLEALYP
jgi:pyridoxamine 5'-phosphate oxidase